jgi:HAMP domain-containing protein
MKSIRSMLLLGLALIGLLFLVQAALLASGQRTVERDVIDNVEKNTVATSQLGELGIVAQQIRRYEKEYFVYVTNPERRENYIKEWSGAADKMNKSLQTMRSNAQNAFSAEDQGKISSWVSAADFYAAEMKKIFALVNERQGQISAATAATIAAGATTATTAKGAVAAPVSAVAAMYSPVEVNSMIGPGKDRLSSVLIKGVSEMSEAKTKATLALPAATRDGFNKLWTGVMTTVVVGLLAAIFLAIKLPSAISKPIATLSEAVERVSKGDLDKAIDVAVPTEFTMLTGAIERMRVAQRALVQRMRARTTA